MRGAQVLWGVLIVLALGLFWRQPSAGVGASRTAPSASPHAVFREIMSPFCPGLTLATCPSPAAEHLRDEIKARLGAGESPSAIELDLAARYGNGIRAMPPPHAVRWLWGVPVMLGVVTALALRRAAKGAASALDDSAEMEQTRGRVDLQARLDEELWRLD